MKTDMIVINPDGSETIYPHDSQMAQVYRALDVAAQRIGMNNAAQYLRFAKANGRGKKRGAYSITAEHELIVKAMPKLLAGEITPEEAMSLLHGYDVLKQRLS